MTLFYWQVLIDLAWQRKDAEKDMITEVILFFPQVTFKES